MILNKKYPLLASLVQAFRIREAVRRHHEVGYPAEWKHGMKLYDAVNNDENAAICQQDKEMSAGQFFFDGRLGQ